MSLQPSRPVTARFPSSCCIRRPAAAPTAPTADSSCAEVIGEAQAIKATVRSSFLMAGEPITHKKREARPRSPAPLHRPESKDALHLAPSCYIPCTFPSGVPILPHKERQLRKVGFASKPPLAP